MLEAVVTRLQEVSLEYNQRGKGCDLKEPEEVSAEQGVKPAPCLSGPG